MKAAPVIGSALLGFVSHLPQGDWRIGAPFFLWLLARGRKTWGA